MQLATGSEHELSAERELIPFGRLMESLDAADRTLGVRSFEEPADRPLNGIDVSRVLLELPETGEEGVTGTDPLNALQERFRRQVTNDAVHLVAGGVEKDNSRIAIDAKSDSQFGATLFRVSLQGNDFLELSPDGRHRKSIGFETPAPVAPVGVELDHDHGVASASLGPRSLQITLEPGF